MTMLEIVPWQIPLAEYQLYRWDNTSEQRRGTAGFAKGVFYLMVSWDHASRVLSALLAGETVPPEVLKDHPDLLGWVNGEHTLFDLRPGQNKRRVTLKEAIEATLQDQTRPTHNDPIDW